MRFIDEATINVQAGDGGRGCVSFRREKYVPRGGPNGGNGGRGGSVYIVPTHNKQSLLDFKYQPKYVAERGEHGMGSDMDGRGGADLMIAVPVGTIVHDEQTHEVLADLTEEGKAILVAAGGNGGRGNMNFATATNRAPKIATPPGIGQIRSIRLELKLLADVGLVGLPNAGKSSFLRVVSRAQPKVANYPFTTLQPNLGVVSTHDTSFVMADLPGLIEGAAEGQGLGHQFLRHVTRNRVLLHLVDISDSAETIEQNIKTIEAEIRAYDENLANKDRFLVFTKADLLPAEAQTERLRELAALGIKGYLISSHSHQGVDALLNDIAILSRGWKHEPPPQEDDTQPPPMDSLDHHEEVSA